MTQDVSLADGILGMAGGRGKRGGREGRMLNFLPPNCAFALEIRTLILGVGFQCCLWVWI